MLGFGNNKRNKDSLPVLVEVVQDNVVFELAQRVWVTNGHNVRPGANNKEFLRFGLVNSKQAVWLQRDSGRVDSYEMILTWSEGSTKYYDIYALITGPKNVSSGDTKYATQILNALLSSAATLPVDKPQ